MDALTDLERFLYKIKRMRNLQNKYFSQRNDSNLRAAKQSEKEVDVSIEQMERKGYKVVPPDEMKQQKLM